MAVRSQTQRETQSTLLRCQHLAWLSRGLGTLKAFRGLAECPPLCPPPGGQLSWSAHRAQGFSAATHRLGWVAPTTKPRPKPLLLKGTLMAQRRPCITQSASRYLMSGPKTLGDYWVHLSLVQMGKLKPKDQIWCQTIRQVRSTVSTRQCPPPALKRNTRVPS